MRGSKKPYVKINETYIQKCLYRHTKKQGKAIWAHNIYIYNYESDFIAITKSGVIYEYEIKVSRADFKRDFNKAKHRAFTKLILKSKLPSTNHANYFYFVCPYGLLSLTEIPIYAGLIYVYANGTCKTIKKARRLHTKYRGLTYKVLLKINQSLSHRFYGT